MRITSLNNEFFEKYDLYNIDRELLNNEENKHNRPYVIILRLKYKNVRQDFAIPFRTNIQNTLKSFEYFSLPPRKETKQNHIHGLHFAKMFPIINKYLEKYNYPDNNHATLTLSVLNKNIDKLVSMAQNYINEFEKGNRVNYCTDIEAIFNAINKKNDISETEDSQ